MTAAPFVTSDQHLAVCLDFVGCQQVGVWNVYSRAIMAVINEARRREGRQPFQNAKAARTAGVPGKRFYLFERTDLMNECKTAYYAERKTKKPQAEDSDIDVTPAQAVRLLAAGLMLNGDYRNLWKSGCHKFQVGDARETIKDSITVTQEVLDGIKDGMFPLAKPGHTYRLGDQLPVAVDYDLSKSKMVDLDMSRENLAAIGL